MVWATAGQEIRVVGMKELEDEKILTIAYDAASASAASASATTGFWPTSGLPFFRYAI